MVCKWYAVEIILRNVANCIWIVDTKNRSTIKFKRNQQFAEVQFNYSALVLCLHALFYCQYIFVQ